LLAGWNLAVNGKQPFPIKGLAMRIAELCPHSHWSLSIVADDGRVGSFDVSPYLEYEAFEDLRDPGEFRNSCNYSTNILLSANYANLR
jgi:hypothetical protein